MIEKYLKQEESTNRPGFRLLVICSNREAALQVHNEIKKKYASTTVEIRSHLSIGGISLVNDIEGLDMNEPEIVIATPGRLTIHLLRTGDYFDNLKYLVLDDVKMLTDRENTRLWGSCKMLIKKLPKTRTTVAFTKFQNELVMHNDVDPKYRKCDVLIPKKKEGDDEKEDDDDENNKPKKKKKLPRFFDPGFVLKEGFEEFNLLENQQHKKEGYAVFGNVKELLNNFVALLKRNRDKKIVVFAPSGFYHKFLVNLLKQNQIFINSINKMDPPAKRLGVFGAIQKSKNGVFLLGELYGNSVLDNETVDLLIHFENPLREVNYQTRLCINSQHSILLTTEDSFAKEKNMEITQLSKPTEEMELGDIVPGDGFIGFIVSIMSGKLSKNERSAKQVGIEISNILQEFSITGDKFDEITTLSDKRYLRRKLPMETVDELEKNEFIIHDKI